MSKAYLLTWNPKKWDFPEGYDAFRNKVINDGYFEMDWAAVNTSIQIGDELFLMRLGDKPRGIVAKGIAIDTVHSGRHFVKEEADAGRTSKYVYMRVVAAGDISKGEYLSWVTLKTTFPSQNWTPQGSGIAIKDEYHTRLNQMWGTLFEGTTINDPMSPFDIIATDNGIIQFICGRCRTQFNEAPRCPECGQLVKEAGLRL